MSEQQHHHHHPPDLADLVQDLDLNTPLHELIGDPAILEQPITFEPQELEQIDRLADEYLHELAEAGLIPKAPPLDMDLETLELFEWGRQLEKFFRDHRGHDRGDDFGR